MWQLLTGDLGMSLQAKRGHFATFPPISFGMIENLTQAIKS